MVSRLALLLICLGSIFVITHIVRRLLVREKELRRFKRLAPHWWEFLVSDLRRLLRGRATQRTIRSRGTTVLEDRDAITLLQAGIDLPALREGYYVTRDVALWISAFLCIIVPSYFEMATIMVVLLLSLVVLGYWGPNAWLSSLWRARQRQFESELPFLIQLISLGAGSGKVGVRVLEDVTDILSEEASRHPFVQDLRRAQWCARTGGTWAEGLARMQLRIGHSEVNGALESLTRFLKAGARDEPRLTALAERLHGCVSHRRSVPLSTLALQFGACTTVTVFGFVLLLRGGLL